VCVALDYIHRSDTAADVQCRDRSHKTPMMVFIDLFDVRLIKILRLLITAIYWLMPHDWRFTADEVQSLLTRQA